MPLGKSKSAVVESMGSPHRSWRKEGKDYWYYNPHSSNAAEKIILIFENGILVGKTRPGNHSELEELEEELKTLLPKDSKNFETLSE